MFPALWASELVAFAVHASAETRTLALTPCELALAGYASRCKRSEAPSALF